MASTIKPLYIEHGGTKQIRDYPMIQDVQGQIHKNLWLELPSHLDFDCILTVTFRYF